MDRRRRCPRVKEFPGWVRLRTTDATGRLWSFVDKAPIFDLADGVELGPAASAAIRCRVVRTLRDDETTEPPLIVVSTAVDGVAAEDGTDEFVVRGERLRYPTLK